METTTRIGMVMFAGVALATAGVLFLPTACTVLTNDAPPDDAGPFEGGDADAGQASCASCIIQQCDGVEAVCLLDSTCVSLSCSPGTGCPCGQGADGGVDPYGALVAYRSCDMAKSAASCSTECGPPPPGPLAPFCATSDGGATDDSGADAGDDAGDASTEAAAAVAVTVDGCASCVSGHCGDPKKACAAGTECERFLACARVCADAACIDTCGTNFASGKEAARELADCTFTACKADCGL